MGTGASPVTARPALKTLPPCLVEAAALRRDGRLRDAVALVEAALARSRTNPIDVAFSDRVQLGLALADLYLATHQRERASVLLRGEAAFAEEINRLTSQTGSAEQIRAASAGLHQLRDRATQVALLGQPAPEIGFADWVLGRPTTLAQQRGRVVLLEFWASWCRPCLAMFPVLRDLHTRYAERGLTILALTRYCIGTQTDATIERARQRDEIRRTVSGRDLNIAVGIASDGQLQQSYGAIGIPAVALVDRAGIVRFAPPVPDKAAVEMAIVDLLKDQSAGTSH